MYTYKSVTTIVPLVVKCNRPSCTVINFSESKIPSKGRKITDTNKIFLERSFDTIVNTLSAILKSQAISLIGLIGKKRNFLFYTRIHFLTLNNEYERPTPIHLAIPKNQISFRDKLIVLARTNRFQSIEQELVSEQEKKK